MASLAPRIDSLVTTATTFAENAVNAAPQLIDGAVTLIHQGGSFTGGVLTVSGLLAEDRIALRHQGVGAGQLGYNAVTGAVTFGGVQIGTASGGQGASFRLTFNAAATTAMVEAVIENLTYANASDTPTASRTLQLSLTDSDGHYLSRTGDGTYGFEGAFAYQAIGQYSSPTLVDLNNDGLLDLVVGDSTGQIRYYRNQGTATAPSFPSVGQFLATVMATSTTSSGRSPADCSSSQPIDAPGGQQHRPDHQRHGRKRGSGRQRRHRQRRYALRRWSRRPAQRR